MLTDKDVQSIANLAHLSFPPEVMEKFKGELNQILQYVENLQSVNTEGVLPTAHAVFKPTPMREDIVAPSFSNDEALANAPDKDAPYFAVPKIIG